MKVLQIPVGPMRNFVYLGVDEKSREAVVVDSGWELGPIRAAVDAEKAVVKYVAVTHHHFDHSTTAQELAKELGAELVVHESSPLQSDLRLGDGEELSLGSTRLRALHTPGHTADSISLFDGSEVFTGDTLFVGTIGRIDEADAAVMYGSLYERLLNLPGETILYPGHDYGEVTRRTLGEERAANPYLRAKDLDGFLSLFS